jgi:choline-glycine betaine transporter
MATMASRGNIRPAKIVILTMGALMGAVASAMLLAGGLEGLQMAAICGSLPFLIIAMALAWYWIKALRQESALAKEGPPGHVDTSKDLVSTQAGATDQAGERDSVVKPAGEGAR